MEQWRHLRQNDERLPPLLVKASFSKNGYTICLTDLSRMWVEKLDQNAIVTRARRRNCSIDPSDDYEQYGILLEKIQNVLQQRSGTVLAISSTDNGDIKLHLEAPLPSPLPVFEWEVDLERRDDSSIESDLVSPLLQQAHSLNRHMQVLITEIQAKDKIIAKITDRLESSGHGLSAVFPGLANVKLDPRKPQQEQYARHVRGLGEFDKHAWTARVSAASDSFPMSRESTDAVFASIPKNLADKSARTPKDEWWQSMPRGRHIALNEDKQSAIQSRETVQQQVSDVDGDADMGQGDDEFQRQATPPQLRQHAPAAPTNGDVDMDEHVDGSQPDEDSTEDEDDLDAPPPRSKPPNRQVPNNKAQPKARTPTTSPSPIPSPKQTVTNPTAPLSTKNGPFTHDEDTEDDDDDLDRPSQASQPAASTSQLPSRQKSQTPQPSSPAAPSPRKRLGKLGGRARTKSPTPLSPVEEPGTDTETSPAPKQPAKPKSKLGTIGGKSKAKPTRSKSPTPAASEPTSTPQPTKKLGTIGGKRALKTSREVTASPETPEPEEREGTAGADRKRQATTRAEPIPAEPEDPVEKANAKRDKLKRELEEKAKAPVKKKRKF